MISLDTKECWKVPMYIIHLLPGCTTAALQASRNSPKCTLIFAPDLEKVFQNAVQ